MVEYFSAEQICAIIKACGQSGVHKFELSDMVVHFDPIQQTSPEVVRFNPEKEYPKMEEESLEQDEGSLKLDRLQQLLIEDPVEAEKLLAEEADNLNAES